MSVVFSFPIVCYIDCPFSAIDGVLAISRKGKREFCVQDLTNPLKSNKIAVEYANDAEGKEYPRSRVQREAGWCKAFDGIGEGRPGVPAVK